MIYCCLWFSGNKRYFIIIIRDDILGAQVLLVRGKDGVGMHWN